MFDLSWDGEERVSNVSYMMEWAEYTEWGESRSVNSHQHNPIWSR